MTVNLYCFRGNTLTMIPDENDTENDSVPEKSNTQFICGVVEGMMIFVINICTSTVRNPNQYVQLSQMLCTASVVLRLC